MAFELPCDWKAGFVLDPTKKSRCGYLTAFEGLGLAGVAADNDTYKISVFTPFSSSSDPQHSLVPVAADGDGLRKIECIGVLESFSWGGGAGDPICMSAYVSTELASQLKAKQKTTLPTTAIKKLSWWIVNYDVEEKAWFEEAYPMTGDKVVAGQLNADGGKDVRLSIAEEPTLIAPNIDVQVFNVYFEIVPGANATYALGFAQGAKKPYVKGWGLQVGNIAKAKLAS